jgi:hypothetical protein
MMLAGLPVPDDAIDELAELVRAAGADDLADRLEQALTDSVKLIALTLDERAIILAALEDPSGGVAVQTGVFGARMEVELVNEGPVTIVLEAGR